MVVLQYVVLILVIINSVIACYKILNYGCNTKIELFKELENITGKLLIIALILYFIFN